MVALLLELQNKKCHQRVLSVLGSKINDFERFSVICDACRSSATIGVHLDRVHLARDHLDGVHLDRVHLAGVHLDRVHLAGVHLARVHLD